MIELHRLTIRQINGNPTLMSDEVFVPEEEVDELVRELKDVDDALIEFAGETPCERAVCARSHIEWLKNELKISRHNEKAFMQTLEQDRAELFALRSRARLARACMEENDPINARVIFGPPLGGSCDGEETRKASGA